MMNEAPRGARVAAAARFIHGRLGAVGRAAMLVFLAHRCGDALNLVAGLWLVPKFVPGGELGAIKLLEQLSALLAVPAAALAWPYTKALSAHLAHGEAGKAKALMRDAFLICAALLLVMTLGAAAALPWIFSRWGIGNGRLALFIIASGALGAFAPFFSGALQAAKNFRAYSFAALAGPPARFLTLVMLLPFRGLTGYFAGQCVGQMALAAAAARWFWRAFGRIRREPYWRDDRAIFAAFVIPLAAGGFAGGFRGTAEMSMLLFIPEADSAAYYILTRFSDIVSYALAPLTFVLFPVFSERHENGADASATLLRGMVFCVAAGAAAGLALNIVGARLLSLHGYWRPYAGYSGLFFLLSLTSGLRHAFTCFCVYELAARRAGYSYFSAAVSVAAGAAVYALGRSPDFAALGLRGVLLVHAATPVLLLVYAAAVLHWRKRRSGI